MAHKVRVRCPLCGMLVWQSRMNKDYPFEFVIQEISGKGYKQIRNRYKKAYMADTDASKIFQSVLAMKMVEKAEELLKKVDADIKIDVRMPEEAEEELTEAYKEVVEAETKKPRKVEPEVEQYVYEVEVGGEEYEVEVPALSVEDMRKSFWGRLGMRRARRGKDIEEMEAIGELEIEHDVKDIEYEFETLFEKERRK